jgi:flavin reductase (DIM6/NTAB) family NADH-FMN oxidoreductase RutF
MEKVMIENSRVGASSAVIAGALVNGRPNYITLGSYGGMSINPPIVYISINKTHYTNAGIKENGYFSVNIPSKNLINETDYVGIVSGKDVDKSAVFSAFYGSINKAPMIEECPVNILCKLINTIDLSRNEVFIGEIVETYVGKEYIVDGKPDINMINPIMLAGGKYYDLGNPVGTPRVDGQALKKEE